MSIHSNQMGSVRDIPVVAVLGETGVGKTRLAIELCRRFGGEIVSADAMQVYEGLDIATNKASPDEMGGILHHMVGVVSPASSGFNVRMFRDMALEAIKECWDVRRSIPVVVGGTNYYIEALLWNQLAGLEEEPSSRVPFDTDILSNEQLHKELERIDPETAEKLHPENRRRVIRSIEIFYGTGETCSKLVGAQQPAPNFTRMCILWLQCFNGEFLGSRLRDRVDDMVRRGLREEIERFHDKWYERHLQLHGLSALSRGVFQAIGLKEFASYLSLKPEVRVSSDGTRAFSDGIERLKKKTVQYARRQRRWIENRIYKAAARDSVGIHCLSTGGAESWGRDVLEPAAQAVSAFLSAPKK